MLQIFTMINNGHKAAKRYMMFLIVLQITVLVVILKQPGPSQKIFVTLSQRFMRAPDGNLKSLTSKSKTSPPKSPPVEAKLELKVEDRNLPLKKQYLDGKLAFPNNRVPRPLEGWSPSNESYRYFQPMEGKDAWIYSAFYVDTPTEPVSILAIGMARNPIPWRIYCHFHLDEGRKFKTQAGHMKKLPEHHNTTVVPVYLECNVPKNLRPKTVSFTFAQKTTMKNSIPVQYEQPRTYNFTVCYAALHSKFNLSSQLIWSIEMNRILGAEQFYVYNFSISSQVDTILRHYSKVGLVTIMQWPVPTLESWYIGQMALINDCLYRNRNVSKFVAFVDTDEMIVPATHPNWKEIIKAIESNPSFQEPTQPSGKSKLNSNSSLSLPSSASSSLLSSSKLALTVNITATSSDKDKTNSSQYHSVTMAGKRRLLSLTSIIIGKQSSLKNKTTVKSSSTQIKNAASSTSSSHDKENLKTINTQNSDPKVNTTKKITSSSSAKVEVNLKQEKTQPKSSNTVTNMKFSSQNTSVTKLHSDSVVRSVIRSLTSNPQQSSGTESKSNPQTKTHSEKIKETASIKESISDVKPPQKSSVQVISTNTTKAKTVEASAKKSEIISSSSKVTGGQNHSNSSLKSTTSSSKPSPLKSTIQENPPKSSSSNSSSSSSSSSKSEPSKSSTPEKQPKSSSSNSSPLSSLSLQQPIGSFLFRNVFFSYKHSSEWTSIKSKFNISKSDETFVRRYRISPMLHYLHYDKPFPARIRSKMIVRPELVRVIGIHFVYGHRQGARSAHVALKAGMLHHYRGFDNEHSNTVTDSAFRFKANLIKRLQQRLTNFPTIFKT